MIIVFFILWACGFIVTARFFGLRVSVQPAVPMRLSVIIPARDEEHNLPRLLESLAAQSVRPYEVLVVDDGSTDGTAEIARKLGADVVESEPLPDGWRGKTWACHQGALKARGGHFLFMDADTWFEVEGLARMLGRYPGGAFSLLPYHAVSKSYEDFSLFFNFSMTAGTVPNGLAGQCFLINREDYQKVGGHESVRGRVLENFRLAEEFREAGIPVCSAIGSEMVSFRMYPQGFRSLVEGWTKGFASGAVRTPLWILLLVVGWMTGLMFPLLGGMMTGDWKLWLAAYALGAFQVAGISRRIGSFHWLGILFYPIPLMFFFGVFGWSALRSGKKVSWKGREIHAD